MKTTLMLALASSLAACGGARQVRCEDPAPVEARGGTPDTAAVAAEVPETPTEAPPAEVRAGSDAPVRVSPNGQARVAFLSQGLNAFVARLEMEAGAAVPEHQDATEEYIHVLEGSGRIVIDGAEHEVTPGSTIFMPANATVSFQNGDARMVALQVFAGPAPAAKYDAWTPRAEE